MSKLFSYQIIKKSFLSVWVWWLVSIFITSINLFAFPASIGAENADILTMLSIEGIGGNGILFITLCAVLFSNVFLTSEVDRGTLAIPLNTPTTRLKILFSKLLVYIVLLLSICLAVGGLGALSPVLHDVKFDYGKWWLLIFAWLLYSFAMGGISFAIGCWFNKSRYTLGTTTVILGSFFFLNIFASLDNLEFCKYFTLQTLFDMTAIIKGENVVPQIIALAVIAIPFYIIGTIKFLKKDLPL